MADVSRERFLPLFVPGGATTSIPQTSIGGFFCSAGGSVGITGTNDQGGSFALVSFTALANTWYPLPFYLGPQGGTITTGAGCFGTLGVL